MRSPLFATTLCVLLVHTSLLAQAPPPPRIQPRGNAVGGMSKSVQLSGQQRKIAVAENGESIAIEDTGDKNITIRHTRTVNGEKKTETYQAPDLETLKKNHPDAAELYRKHTEGVLNAAQMQAQLQAQLQLRIANGGQFPGPGNLSPRPGTGSRQLMSSTRKQTVEIEDQYGENIVVRITDRTASEPQVRKIEAKNLAELEERDAEAAGHYKRLALDN